MNKTVKKAGVGNGCIYYKKCGGCQLQNMTYEEQLSFKQSKEITLFGRYCHVNEIIGMESPFHYRTKVQAAFGMKSGKIISGVYQSSTHKIVDVKNCMIEDEDADKIIFSIGKLISEFKLSIFNEKTLKGFLRHVLIRKGYFTDEIMVVLVTGTPIFPKCKEFVSKLTYLHPEIVTVVQSVNNKFTPLVLGDTFKTLYGNGYISDTILGKTFRISPSSFYQVNPLQTQILYKKAIDFLELDKTKTLIDAYCGTGTIGIIASDYAKEVIGVEKNKSAIMDAKQNAKINNVKNISFYCADAGKFMVDLAEEKVHIDAVIMDPPRAGSSKEFIDSLGLLLPDKISYISCDPDTLSRDIKMLIAKGYKVKKVQPVDMFPHTSHIETVVLLIKKQK